MTEFPALAASPGDPARGARPIFPVPFTVKFALVLTEPAASCPEISCVLVGADSAWGEYILTGDIERARSWGRDSLWRTYWREAGIDEGCGVDREGFWYRAGEVHSMAYHCASEWRLLEGEGLWLADIAADTQGAWAGALVSSRAERPTVAECFMKELLEEKRVRGEVTLSSGFQVLSTVWS
ncbi:hypothetical protein [Embleya sp. MST-111070]|uniref:hypothetical protein n=1 Tax=Embleya sp. MST-111070 TaxID=3398231 RepID=UPI003F73E4F6